MEFVEKIINDEIATIMLNRGKVNALNEQMVKEIKDVLNDIIADPKVKAAILTGHGKFFSFGFDIPEFYEYSKENFTQFLSDFSDLYLGIYTSPKPVIAALNGHTIAGGCILASVCDYKIMETGKSKISLNEINLGASIFFGVVEILKNLIGQKNAEKILFSGSMFSADEALDLGLIDSVSEPGNLMDKALKTANEYGSKNSAAFSAIKGHFRNNIVEEIKKKEKDSIDEFVEIWYSDKIRKKLKEVKIHS